MKIIELYFVLFSKLYVKFSNRENDWFYVPLLIISLILCLNLMIFSKLYFDLSPYYFMVLYFIIYFGLIFLLGSKRKKGKSFIKNYKLSKTILLVLFVVLFVDFFGMFKTLKYVREKKW